MNTKELLRKRRMLKRKKPEFIRQDAHKKKRLSWSWRKPKGSDSKMRVNRKGYRRTVKVGWGSPASVRGLGRTALRQVSVSNVAALQKADSKTDIIVIGSDVGTKKKLAIIEQAMSKGMQVANYKDPKKFLEETKKSFEKRKKEREKIKEDREKKKEAAKKEAEKKKAKEKEEKKKEETEEQTEEEKKMEEKKEKDKMLITTQ